MSKVWDLKVKVKCRDCGRMTGGIIVSNDHTQIFPFCQVQELMVYPDVEHFCDDFEKCSYSRESPKVQEREIATKDGVDPSTMKCKEGHEQAKHEIDESDIVGFVDADGNVKPLSELPGYEDSEKEE